MKVVYYSSLILLLCCTLCSQPRLRKDSDTLADLKKRGELFLSELGITADQFKQKIKEFQKSSPTKAHMLENIQARLAELKTKNETLNLDKTFEELKSYIKPENLQQAKEKLIQIRSHIHDLNKSAFKDLQDWSKAVVADSELWL